MRYYYYEHLVECFTHRPRKYNNIYIVTVNIEGSQVIASRINVDDESGERKVEPASISGYTDCIGYKQGTLVMSRRFEDPSTGDIKEQLCPLTEITEEEFKKVMCI